MSTPKFYVLCDQNCKYEGMSKEQILAAIVQAVEGGTIGEVDTGFITTIKTITGTPLQFFVGTQAEYDALTAEQRKNLFAIITNDATKEGIYEAIKEYNENVVSLENWRDAITNGSAKAAEAKHATNADIAILADGLTRKNCVCLLEITSSFIGVDNYTHPIKIYATIIFNSAAPTVYITFDDFKEYFINNVQSKWPVMATGEFSEHKVVALVHNGTDLFVRYATNATKPTDYRLGSVETYYAKFFNIT